MASEIKGTPASAIAIYPQAGTGPGGPLAQIKYHTRVFVRSTGGGWSQVRLLSGDNTGLEGWVPAGAITTSGPQTVADDVEMSQIFEVVRTATFTPPGGSPTPIPYRYPKDGCFARAQVMATLLKQAGYTVDKQWAICAGGLTAKTPHGGDQPGYGEPLQVGWWYHVAPIVYGQMDAPVPFVLDPSTADKPVPIGDWVANIAVHPVGPEMSYDGLRTTLAAAKAYPATVTWLVRSSDTVYSPPDPADVTRTVVATPQSPEQELAKTAALVPAHDTVAALDGFFRHCLRAMDNTTRDSPAPYPAYAADRGVVQGSIQHLNKQLRTYILTSFPKFLQDWQYTFGGTGIETDTKQLIGLLSA
jgi:hypothetical protein